MLRGGSRFGPTLADSATSAELLHFAWVRHKNSRDLFGDAVPLLVADAQVLALLVEELALLGDQKHVAHEFAHCNGKEKEN